MQGVVAQTEVEGGVDGLERKGVDGVEVTGTEGALRGGGSGGRPLEALLSGLGRNKLCHADPEPALATPPDHTRTSESPTQEGDCATDLVP